MNKNDLKKLIKTRIANQKEALKASMPSNVAVAHQFYQDHAPKKLIADITDRVDSIRALGNKIEQTFCRVNKNTYSGFGSAVSTLENIDDSIKNRLAAVFHTAMWNGASWKTGSSFNDLMNYPIREKLEARADELTAQFYDQQKALDKLELELLAVVTAAKNAAKAMEALDELGITLDIPEAKEVKSNLPAVVSLSVSTTLFNKDIKKLDAQ